MERLYQRGSSLGLTTSEVDKALTLGRSSQELAWVKGRRELFEEERILEYECYDNNWHGQGRAVLTLKSWEDAEAGLFTGSHGPSSDGYYGWFAEHQMGLENGLYNLCDCEAAHCRVRKKRGDGRELIHVDTWRLLTPAAMVGTGYLKGMGLQLAEAALASAARDKKANTPGLWSGLDALLAAHEDEAPPPNVDKGRADARSRSPKRRESMKEYLMKQANKHGEAVAPSKKKKKEDRKARSHKKRRASSDTSSGERSDSSSFQLTPARGGIELWRVAQKKPGRLTRLALDEMTRYLTDKVESADLETKWAGQRAGAYLSQIILAAHPSMTLRMQRELQTISVTLDHLLAGRLAQGSDTLTQRLKACETALLEGNWLTARHLELIPPAAASLVRAEEREMAAKQELKAAKLKESLRKVGREKEK